MKNKILFFLMLLMCLFYYNSYGLVDEKISSTAQNNTNSSGTIITKEYKSDIHDYTESIKSFSYVDLERIPSKIKDNYLSNLTEITDAYSAMHYVLVPRVNNTSKEVETNFSPIYNMERLLSNRYHYIYISLATEKEKSNILNPCNTIKSAQSVLSNITSYVAKYDLTDIFNDNQIKKIFHNTLGNYGLFMPENLHKLNNFNGFGRVFPSAVTTINDLLLPINEHITIKDIDKEKIQQLQLIIFNAVKQLKTFIFVDEFIGYNNLGYARMPVALIDRVSLDENQNITLDLLFFNKFNNNIDKYFDSWKFIEAKNHLLTHNDLRFLFSDLHAWEAICYKFKSCNDFSITNTVNDASASRKYYFMLDSTEVISRKSQLQNRISYDILKDTEITVIDKELLKNLYDNFTPLLFKLMKNYQQSADYALYEQELITTNKSAAEVMKFFIYAITSRIDNQHDYKKFYFDGRTLSGKEYISIILMQSILKDVLNIDPGICKKLLHFSLNDAKTSDINDNLKYNFNNINQSDSSFIDNGLHSNFSCSNKHSRDKKQLYNKFNRCEHSEYTNNKVMFKLNCCDKYWSCIICHNDYATKMINPFSICPKQNSIEYLKCNECSNEQKFTADTGHSCQQCNIKFSKYYCGKCNLFSSIDVNIQHCDSCNTCWKTDNTQSIHHCNTCNICVTNFEKHQCNIVSVSEPCLLCLKKIIDTKVMLTCKHQMHKKCFNLIDKNGIPDCPICGIRYKKRFPCGGCITFP
jgi:RING finger/CHY zinc finger protein 1